MRGALGITFAVAGGCSNDETARQTPESGMNGAAVSGGASSTGGARNTGSVRNGTGGASTGGVPSSGGVGAGGLPATGGQQTSSGGARDGGTPREGGTPDDGGSCSASVQSSCLGRFFEQANQCFRPTGTCVVQTAANGKHVCWSNGAKLVFNDGTNGGGFTYYQESSCFYGSWSVQGGVPSSYTFTINGGDLLVYDPRDGKTTCLDGTMTTVAPDFGGCSSITSLLALDDTGCAPGSCN